MVDISTAWETRHKAHRIAHDTDQTEWKAIRYGTINVDAGTVDEEMGGELADEAGTGEEEIAVVREGRASSITEEIDRRARLLGEMYPFKRTGNSIRYSKSFTRVYEFCLSISFISELKRVDETDKYESLSSQFGKQRQIAFERLVRDVLVCHLGTKKAIGYRTGYPNDTLEERPPNIKGIFAEMCERSGGKEWCWSPDTDHPDEPTVRDLKDMGLDVVAWLPMPDMRGTNLYLATQCACGLTDWDLKLDTPNFGRIGCWVRPVSQTKAAKVFSIPFHIANDAYFRELSSEANAMMLDRSRITAISSDMAHKRFVKNAAKQSYAKLVNEMISRLKQES